MGESFEFTPFGVVPHTESTVPVQAKGAFAGAGAAIAAARTIVSTVNPLPPQLVSPADGGSVKPIALSAPAAHEFQKFARKQWVKELRARLKLVEREIKALKGLEAEAEEIKRLISAAQNKPRAIVTPINSARRSG